MKNDKRTVTYLTEEELNTLKEKVEQAKKSKSYTWRYITPSQSSIVRLALDEYFINHPEDFKPASAETVGVTE